MPIRVYDKARQQVIEVSGDEAATGLGEGRFDPVDQTLTFARGNETWTADAADAGQMLGQGFSLVDQEEANAIDLRREETDIGSTAQGLAERGLAGATFGLSSIAAEALGADPKAMRARAEGLDWIGTAAEVGGALAATPLTGGAALEGRIAGGLARAGAPRAAVRLLPGTGRGMVEGVAQGAGIEIDESVLGNRDLAADQLFQNMAHGLFLGGGASLGLGAVAMGAKRAPIDGMRSVLGRTNAASGGLATREAAEMAVKGDDRFWESARSLAMKQAEAAGGDAAAAGRLIDEIRTKEGNDAVLRVFKGLGGIEREAIQSVGPGLQTANAGFDAVRAATAGAGKARAVDSMIPTEAIHTAARQSDELLRTMRERVDKMIAENVGSGGGSRYGGAIYDPTTLRNLDIATQRAEVGMQQAVRANLQRQLGEGRALAEVGGVSAERSAAGMAHQVVDQYKRDVGEILAGNGGWRPRPGQDAAVKATNDVMRDMYRGKGGLQDFLEDSGRWGKAADYQRELNGAYSRMFESEAAFRGQATGLGKVLDPATPVSAREALQVVRQFRRTGGDTTIATLDDVLEARLDYFKVLEKHVDLDDATRGEIAKVRKATEDLRADFKKQARYAGIADDLQAQRAAEGSGSPSILAASPTDMLAMGAGALVGGIPGAIIGRVASYVARPYATMKVLATVKGLLDKSDLSMASALGRLGKRVKGEASTKRTSLPIAAAATAGIRMDRDERRKEALDRAIRIQQSPEALERMLAAPLYDLQKVAPGVSGVLQQRVQAAAAFLASKAPPVYQPPMSTRPPLVAPSEQAKFDRYVEAVTDPVAAVERIADGNVTKEAAEAIRAVYPALYEDIQDQIHQMLADAQAEGKEVPYDVRISLGLFFQTPTDQALDPRMLAAIQGAVTTPEIENAPITPPRPLTTNSRSRMTNMQRLEDWTT